MKTPLPLSFYQREDVVKVAHDLLGKYLFTKIGNQITGGIIIETEAYKGAEDRACHAYNYRRTKRTEIMYENGGVTYVYLCYGIHCLLNVVTYTKGNPHAVLIRSILPKFGIDIMLKRRKKQLLDSKLTNGPGSVCRALGIDLTYNGTPLNSSCIWIADSDIPVSQVYQGPRIGVDYAGPDAHLPWRFKLENL